MYLKIDYLRFEKSESSPEVSDKNFLIVIGGRRILSRGAICKNDFQISSPYFAS